MLGREARSNSTQYTRCIPLLKEILRINGFELLRITTKSKVNPITIFFEITA